MNTSVIQTALIKTFVIVLLCLNLQPVMAVKYLSQKEFLTEAFGKIQSDVTTKTLWLTDDLQENISTILGHRYPKLRLRYWQHSKKNQTVWFLDEIGKERPISFAISVIDKTVHLMKVLEFRESRGGEIHMSTFQNQFNNISLNSKQKLDKHIDGITGATMSVSAMKKITILALQLHSRVTKK